MSREWWSTLGRTGASVAALVITSCCERPLEPSKAPQPQDDLYLDGVVLEAAAAQLRGWDHMALLVTAYVLAGEFDDTTEDVASDLNKLLDESTRRVIPPDGHRHVLVSKGQRKLISSLYFFESRTDVCRPFLLQANGAEGIIRRMTTLQTVEPDPSVSEWGEGKAILIELIREHFEQDGATAFPDAPSWFCAEWDRLRDLNQSDRAETLRGMVRLLYWAGSDLAAPGPQPRSGATIVTEGAPDSAVLPPIRVPAEETILRFDPPSGLLAIDVDKNGRAYDRSDHEHPVVALPMDGAGRYRFFFSGASEAGESRLLDCQVPDGKTVTILRIGLDRDQGHNVAKVVFDSSDGQRRVLVLNPMLDQWDAIEPAVSPDE